jgi:hypothetical protein
LAVDPKAAQGRATERIIVDLLGETLDGKSVGVLVFADDGYLTELEVYDLEGHTKAISLPAIDSLRSFEEAGSRAAKI